MLPGELLGGKGGLPRPLFQADNVFLEIDHHTLVRCRKGRISLQCLLAGGFTDVKHDWCLERTWDPGLVLLMLRESTSLEMEEDFAGCFGLLVREEGEEVE